jgi:hypothetical protein
MLVNGKIELNLEGGFSDVEEPDHIAAELEGENSDLTIHQIVCECPKCHNWVTLEFT